MEVEWVEVEWMEVGWTQMDCDKSKSTTYYTEDTVSERLRRTIRNRLGFARVGSNPTGVVFFASQYFSACSCGPSGTCLRRVGTVDGWQWRD